MDETSTLLTDDVTPYIVSTTQLTENSSDSSVNIDKSRVILVSYHQLPLWQQDNHYILHHYVPQTSSFRKCFDSLFYLHNESVNIYTHLVPSVFIFLLSAVYTFNYLPTYATTTIFERFVILQFFVGLYCCLTLSSIFHSVKCHSLKVCKVGNQLDYLGIIVLISTSLISIVYFSYWDNVKDMVSFITIICVLGALCTVMTLNKKFASPAWRPYRAIMFIFFGLSGVLPIAYGFKLFGWAETVARSQLYWVLSEGILYILGASLYALRFPERTNPGKYDLFGNSHQIFHIMVDMAAWCHTVALIGSYKYCHESTIPGT